MTWTSVDGAYRLDAGSVECWVLARADARPAILDAPRARLNQVHSARIARADSPGLYDGDGLVTDVPGLALAVRVADCLPVFVWDKKGRAVGICHAGWRGTAAGIATALVNRMVTDFRVLPGDLACALGPAIGACCYEVKDDVRAAFRDAGYDQPGVFMNRAGRMFLDLKEANRRQLRESGLSEIADLDRCTFCAPEALPSARRTGTSDRILALVRLLPRSDAGTP